jgi:glutamine amidotransferase
MWECGVMIVVIDYGMGNNGSIVNMLKKIGAEAKISSDPSVIGSATKLILPGVGSFDNGMRNLEELGFIPALNKKVLDGTPILGICLGVQLFTKSSEEGNLAGLGWINARTIRFHFGPQSNDLKIPHMGWNTLKISRAHPIFNGLEIDPRFYFVHSYHLVCAEQTTILATTHHGYDFASIVAKGNILGTQFHPEKSHKYGLQLLRNWVLI